MVVKALNKKEQEVEFDADYCLVAVGRRPYTEGLNLNAAGLEIDEKGRFQSTKIFKLKLLEFMRLEMW